MKKVLGIVLGAVFCFSLFTTAAHAADKLAYVDLSKLFGEYNKTKDYDKVLSGKEGVYTAERDKKVNELKDMESKFNLLSEKEKPAKKTELEAKINVLKEFDRQKQTDLRKEQDEKMKEILKDIETAVKQHSEKEGYTLVFNDRVLVYQSSQYNITDKVLAILNAGYVKK